MAKVLVLDADYENAGEAIKRVLDEFPLDVAGKKVLLKPNALGPYPPESHVNTHPAVIKALADQLENAGAEVMVGDNPGTQGYGAVEKTGKVSGLIKAAGDRFVNLATEVEKVTLPGRETAVNVSRKVMECDVLISVPKFKTHTYTRITGAIKNSYGFLVGGDKARLHLEFPRYREFSDILVDIYRLRIPDLVVTDGVIGLQGNGPSNKDTYRAGKILASDNGVCLDGVMTTMMRMRPEKVRMLEYARDEGLGDIDPAKIEVKGQAGPLRRFRRPAPGIPQWLGSAWTGAFFPDIGKPSFDIDAGLCNSCASCKEACPAGAISMEDKRPSYDYGKCIACYCCMELCPQQAITLHDTLRTRIYRWLGYLQ